MKRINWIFLILIGNMYANCGGKSEAKHATVKEQAKINNKVSKVEVSEEVDEVEPPPPILASNFKNLQAWLNQICDSEKTQKSISTFNFGLFESVDNYTIFLVGLNEYDTEQSSVSRIEFKPSNMYFRLPKKEYENLNRKQVVARLTLQLKDFTKTKKFKTSFFAKAKSITTDFSGEIWRH